MGGIFKEGRLRRTKEWIHTYGSHPHMITHGHYIQRACRVSDLSIPLKQLAGVCSKGTPILSDVISLEQKLNGSLPVKG